MPPPPVPRVPLKWDVGSVLDATATATLRANLHELAADFHDLAAAIHDLRAEEHVQAVLHSLGDPIRHQLQADLRRTAAAAERASAQKERARARSAMRLSKIADVGAGRREDPQPKSAEQRDEGEVVGVRGPGGGEQRLDDSVR
jgi:hypothetical protein